MQLHHKMNLRHRFCPLVDDATITRNYFSFANGKLNGEFQLNHARNIFWKMMLEYKVINYWATWSNQNGLFFVFFIWAKYNIDWKILTQVHILSNLIDYLAIRSYLTCKFYIYADSKYIEVYDTLYIAIDIHIWSSIYL